jgi:nucleotide-sensitive chloride channel 1A
VSGEGFTIPYRKMSFHAVSRDPAVHPQHCLYIMVNGSLGTKSFRNYEIASRNFNYFVPGDEEGEEENVPVQEDDEEEMTEVRFVPEDASVLDDAYKAIGDCSILHPDPASDMSDDDDDGS